MANELSKIKKLAGKRTDLVDALIELLEKKAGGAQSELIASLVESIVDKMDKDGDNIKNTVANKRLLSTIDTVFNQFESKGMGLDISKTILESITKLTSFNENYFSSFADKIKLGKIFPQVQNDINSWLGVDNKGRLQENGYLKKLITDQTIRNKVKDIVLSSVVTQEGYQTLKKKLGDYITDSGDNAGALKKYYRNFVYDTYSQIDRTSSKLFADKLGLRFAIYEGGIIKTSRKFCRKHNSNVYSYDEIAEFDITEARPPGYNPFIDLGGYGCRHHLNWIADTLAYALRPELRELYPPRKAA